MKKLFFIVVLFLLAGCASPHIASDKEVQQMYSVLNSLSGNAEVDRLFKVLGYPAGQKYLGDRKLYVWSVDKMNSTPHVNFTPNSGSSISYTQAHLQCTLNVEVVDMQGREIFWDYSIDGNKGGCTALVRRINSGFPSA